MNRKLRVALVMALLAGLVNSIPAKAVSANPNTVCAGSTCTVSFPYTGDFYQWTVPSTGTYTLEVWGAQGGHAGYNGTNYQSGAAGGYSTGTLSLTSGQTIYIYVGGQGAGLNDTTTLTRVAGGWNGGGQGYSGNLTNNNRAGGGGGATDIRTGGQALSNRVIVAGGGGGGTYFSTYGTNTSGVGGGSSGADGYNSTYTSTYSGKGGTQLTGGANGVNANQGGSYGTLGLGGNGETHSYGAGGGGAGYYGGGGAGTGMAAGGGSGYIGGVTGGSTIAGNASMPNPVGGNMTGRLGDGFARITYTYSVASLSLGFAGNAKVVNKGESLLITATSDTPGKVTFFVDGKKIPGCIGLSIGVGTRTCTWKAAIQKISRIKAYIAPSGGAAATFSSELSISVVKRTGTR